MTAYATGTVAVTNGSVVVDGAGTNFVPPNVYPGDFLVLTADGKLNEIDAIESATRLRLVRPFVGATAGGQAFFVASSQSHEGDLALRAGNLLNAFGDVVAGIGQGLIQSGTVAAPGIRFQADQDTGLFRSAENQLGLVTGGVTRFLLTSGESALASAILSVGSTTALSGTGGQVHFRDDTATRRWASGIPNVGGATRYLIFDIINNVEAVSVLAGGRVGLNTLAPTARLHVTSAGSEDTARFTDGQNYTLLVRAGGAGVAVVGGNTGSAIALASDNIERARCDTNGNFLVGVTSGDSHTIHKPVSQGSVVARIQSSANLTAVFYSTNNANFNAAATGLAVGANSVTGRGVTTPGTFNAGGQDYAEYMKKAGVCGVLAKGQIIGIDDDGHLTDRFSRAHSFVIKSTDPAYVGGDTWSPDPAPVEPVLAMPAYDGPPEPSVPGAAPAALATIGDRIAEPTREAGEEDLAFISRMAAWIVQDAARVKAMDARPTEVEAHAIAETEHVAAEARFKVDLAAWQKATAAHAVDVAAAETRHTAAVEQHRADKAAWDAKMEAARQCVDRVAFSGQVPCNVAAGTFKPGDYIVGAKGKNDEIVGLVVTNVAMRLNPGQRCDAVGKVWRIMEDGRAWVAVLIG